MLSVSSQTLIPHIERRNRGTNWTLIPPVQKADLLEMLVSFHNAFSLSEEERGEAKPIQMSIATGTKITTGSESRGSTSGGKNAGDGSGCPVV